MRGAMVKEAGEAIEAAVDFFGKPKLVLTVLSAPLRGLFYRFVGSSRGADPNPCACEAAIPHFCRSGVRTRPSATLLLRGPTLEDNDR